MDESTDNSHGTLSAPENNLSQMLQKDISDSGRSAILDRAFSVGGAIPTLEPAIHRRLLLDANQFSMPFGLQQQ